MTFDDVEHYRAGNLWDCFSLRKAFKRAYSPYSFHRFLCQDHLQTAHSLSVWFGYKGRQTGHSGLVSVILGSQFPAKARTRECASVAFNSSDSFSHALIVA